MCGLDLIYRPLIVGMAPGPRTPHGRPALDPDGRGAGRRLFLMCGIERGVFTETFERTNLFPTRAGTIRNGKGDAIDAEAAVRAADMIVACNRGRLLILCGGAVARAFGMNAPPYQFKARDGLVLVTIPHPSGVNMHWNKKNNRDKLRLFMNQIAASKRKLVEYL